MKAAISLTFVFFLIAGMSVQAQRKSVTNTDLEKFRQKRLQAEQDYKENYEKMGFPSPEELQRKIEQSNDERFELAARLGAERLERERLAIERERLGIERENLALERQTLNPAGPGPFYDGYPGYPGGIYLGRPYRGFRGSRFGRTYTNVGNGIPLVNYYGTPVRRGPAVRMGRR